MAVTLVVTEEVDQIRAEHHCPRAWLDGRDAAPLRGRVGRGRVGRPITNAAAVATAISLLRGLVEEGTHVCVPAP